MGHTGHRPRRLRGRGRALDAHRPGRRPHPLPRPPDLAEPAGSARPPDLAGPLAKDCTNRGKPPRRSESRASRWSRSSARSPPTCGPHPRPAGRGRRGRAPARRLPRVRPDRLRLRRQGRGDGRSPSRSPGPSAGAVAAACAAAGRLRDLRPAGTRRRPAVQRLRPGRPRRAGRLLSQGPPAVPGRRPLRRPRRPPVRRPRRRRACGSGCTSATTARFPETGRVADPARRRPARPADELAEARRVGRRAHDRLPGAGERRLRDGRQPRRRGAAASGSSAAARSPTRTARSWPSPAPDAEEILYAEVDPARARRKRLVRVPGKHEIDRIADRRPEFYGGLLAPPVEGRARRRAPESVVSRCGCPCR